MSETKYLKIDSRDRRKGEFVYCGECGRNINNTCWKSGKKIYTCKFPEKHQFKVSYHVPNTKSTTITAYYDTRDYDEVYRLSKSLPETDEESKCDR